MILQVPDGWRSPSNPNRIDFRGQGQPHPPPRFGHQKVTRPLDKNIIEKLSPLATKDFESKLVGGWTNPLEKYESKWKSSPSRCENQKYLKPPASKMLPNHQRLIGKSFEAFHGKCSKKFPFEPRKKKTLFHFTGCLLRGPYNCLLPT